MGKPSYETLPTSEPIWASEPFRLFFPLGILAGAFGLILWPMHYFGWWPLYPALQHPRLLIFGFGAAFVIGFLGTAWPRFLESTSLTRPEVISLAVGWTLAQLAYAKGMIGSGDGLMALTLAFLIGSLGIRLRYRQSNLPPPGFALAFLSVGIGLGVAVSWTFGLHLTSPETDYLLRLLAYQGFLLLPLLGVGSYLFLRILQQKGGPAKRRAVTVWVTAAVILASFVVEVFFSARLGNLLRVFAIIGWGIGALPVIFRPRISGTRAWALQSGLLLITTGFLCRTIWPHETFAFEHFLFLGGFSQLMLLVGERVVVGHCESQPIAPAGTSKLWRWIVWLMILTVATRATADLVPSTRISHHIYAAVMLIGIFIVWLTPILRAIIRSTYAEYRPAGEADELDRESRSQ